MANIWFGSDFHFGHKRIAEFRSEFISSEEENRNKILEDCCKHVTKRDILYVLGDAAFTMDTVGDFDKIPGKKILVRGNHDLLDTQVYLKHFDAVYGIFKYKEFWLSHAPIHPQELRGKVNLHGHVHYDSVRLPFNPVTDVKQILDTRYLNLCCENLWLTFGRSIVSLDEIRQHLKQ